MTLDWLAKMRHASPAIAPVPKWRPRRTLIDLYNERDQTRWFWRMMANLSTLLIMAGCVKKNSWEWQNANVRLSFLIYPTAFSDSPYLKVDQSATSIVAIILLALGFTVSVTLWFICTSWMFQLDIIFLCVLSPLHYFAHWKYLQLTRLIFSSSPCLSTCVFGLLNITFYLAVHNRATSQWNSSSISAITLASISTLIYAVLSLITFRKIHIVRSRDAMHRHTADADSIHLDPEDEQQRQQLLRLLQQRDSTKKVSSEASESTFRIDLPDSFRRSTTLLSPPSNVYERNRIQSNVASSTFANWPPYQTPTITTEPPILEIPRSHDLNPPIDPRLNHIQQAIPHGTDGSGGGGGGGSGGSSDFGVPGIVNTRYPVDKATEAGYSLGTHQHLLHERHPLERERAQYRMETEEEEERRRRSLSRESRRVEIEMESRRSPPEKKETGKGNVRGELEGVEVVPRIIRVETDGWELRGGGGGGGGGRGR